jgi:hypothetical protein
MNVAYEVMPLCKSVGSQQFSEESGAAKFKLYFGRQLQHFGGIWWLPFQSSLMTEVAGSSEIQVTNSKFQGVVTQGTKILELQHLGNLKYQ